MYLFIYLSLLCDPTYCHIPESKDRKSTSGRFHSHQPVLVQIGVNADVSLHVFLFPLLLSGDVTNTSITNLAIKQLEVGNSEREILRK